MKISINLGANLGLPTPQVRLDIEHKGQTKQVKLQLEDFDISANGKTVLLKKFSVERVCIKAMQIS